MNGEIERLRALLDANTQSDPEHPDPDSIWIDFADSAVNALPALLEVAEAARAYREAQTRRHPESHDDWADGACSRCLGQEYGCEAELDAALARLDGADHD
jgi:hypothetical protein